MTGSLRCLTVQYSIPAGEANKDQADHSHDQGKDEEEERLIEMSDCIVQYNIPAS